MEGLRIFPSEKSLLQFLCLRVEREIVGGEVNPSKYVNVMLYSILMQAD